MATRAPAKPPMLPTGTAAPVEVLVGEAPVAVPETDPEAEVPVV